MSLGIKMNFEEEKHKTNVMNLLWIRTTKLWMYASAKCYSFILFDVNAIFIEIFKTEVDKTILHTPFK